MRFNLLDGPVVVDAVLRASGLSGQTPASTGGPPDEVLVFLARLRLLEAVPFSHLVPDSELLPPESIRFFYVDREWTDALVEGALSIGTVTTADREHLQCVYAAVRAAVDAEERRVRARPDERPARAPAGALTGFLLRSAAVSGWPGLHVRAYANEVADDAVVVDEGASDPNLLPLVRIERLAPAVLLALFDGKPKVVHVEEPRHGIQFGVDLVARDGGAGASVRLRDAVADNAAYLAPETRVDVPFRRGAPGVIHLRELARDIEAVPETHVVRPGRQHARSGDLALELLQFPYRQVFGRTDDDPRDAFRPTVGIKDIRDWYRRDA